MRGRWITKSEGPTGFRVDGCVSLMGTRTQGGKQLLHFLQRRVAEDRHRLGSEPVPKRPAPTGLREGGLEVAALDEAVKKGGAVDTAAGHLDLLPGRLRVKGHRTEGLERLLGQFAVHVT